MAKVISVEQPKAKKPTLTTIKNNNVKSSKPPLFRKINYILMVCGVVFLFIGYILLVGGGSEDPEVFNPEIFNARRLVFAPIMMFLGLLIEVFAIMYHSKAKKTTENSDRNETKVDEVE